MSRASPTQLQAGDKPSLSKPQLSMQHGSEATARQAAGGPPKLDAFDVTLQTTDAGLDLSAADKPGRVGLPVWPHGDYEVAGSFTIAADSGNPTILVPTANSRGMLLMNWRAKNCSGLGWIRGNLPDDASNPSRVSPSKIQAGRRHAFRVRVASDGGQVDVAVELDEEPYFRWSGPESDLTFRDPGWDIPHQRTIGIGANDRVTYHDRTLTMLDGEAWLLRPPPQ